MKTQIIVLDHDYNPPQVVRLQYEESYEQAVQYAEQYNQNGLDLNVPQLTAYVLLPSKNRAVA